MQHRDTDVTVIGAGVAGLTTALCLAESGLSVAVHAAEPPLQTTSVAAGAIFGPHMVGNDERIAGWAAVTMNKLSEMAGDAGQSANGAAPQSFVHLATGIAATRTAGAAPPDFAADAPSLSACDPARVPPGYKSAWRLTAPLVSMPEYLEYLYQRYLRSGGQPVVLASYPTLADAASSAASPVLVNCPGAGASQFVPDPEVVPVRGQAVLVANPGISEFFVGIGPDDGDLTYMFPHGERLVLGGTEQPGNWSREPDEPTAARIIAACAAIHPKIAAAPVLAHRVGLRPFRPEVRLEAEQLPAGPWVVHNYGHGGSGVTLSWGCARDAAGLARAALAR
ncbi:MAG TPA: FAD-dependent oxidoreductase [Streptosporangiaceae bacterium]|nr:FAD-dependent oxidoreductase [Streptosporangiaceae bacterium]